MINRRKTLIRRMQTGLCMISFLWLSVLPLLAEPHILKTNNAYSAVSGKGAYAPPDYVYLTATVNVERAADQEVFISKWAGSVVMPTADDKITMSVNGTNNDIIVYQSYPGASYIAYSNITAYLEVGSNQLVFKVWNCFLDEYGCEPLWVLVWGEGPLDERIDEKASSAEPIELTSGNLYFGETDLYIPCPGFPLSLSRHYDSIKTNNAGSLGGKWIHNLDIRLSDTNFVAGGITNYWKILKMGDGQTYWFQQNAGNQYIYRAQPKLIEAGGERFAVPCDTGWRNVVLLRYQRDSGNGFQSMGPESDLYLYK
jgi:hypothetical protein